MTKDEYLAKHGPWAGVYTRVMADGSNFTIGIHELLTEIKAMKMQAELIPVDHEQVVRIVMDNAITVDRIHELLELMTNHRKPIEPVVVCMDESGKCFIADGHHRFVLADALGQKVIGAFICYPAMWRQHLITDMEPLTKEQLRAAPHPSQGPSPWKQNQ